MGPSCISLLDVKPYGLILEVNHFLHFTTYARPDIWEKPHNYIQGQRMLSFHFFSPQSNVTCSKYYVSGQPRLLARLLKD